jgi:hypothetical protein
VLSLVISKRRQVMRFVDTLSDQTKEMLVQFIDLSIAFCLIVLTYKIIEGVEWLVGAQ